MELQNTLESVGADLAKMLDGQAALRKRLDQQDEWIKDVERKATQARFPVAPAAKEGASPPAPAVNYEAVGTWFRGRALKRPGLEAEGLKMLGAHTKAAMQEDTNAEGGYLVPTIVAAEIHRLADYIGLTRRLARIVPMRTKTHQLPTQETAPSVALVAEEGTIPDGAPASPFGQATLTAKKLGALFTLSEELIADAAPDILAEYVARGAAEAIAKAEDAQAFEGDGTGQNFTGLFAASGVASVAVSAALTNLDPFFNGWAKLPIEAIMAETLAIVMHPRAWRDAQKLKVAQYSGDTNGAYRLGTLLPATPRTIGGIPVHVTDQILANRGGGTNETTAYLGSFRGVVMGNRQALEMRVDPWTKMDTAQLRVRVMERIGISVVIPSAFVKLTGIQVAA